MPDTVKHCRRSLDEKTGYIGVIAWLFQDDQATEWKQIEPVESIGHHSYRLLVHIRASAIEMKKRKTDDGNNENKVIWQEGLLPCRSIFSNSSVTASTC